MSDLETPPEQRLRKYNLKKQAIELRPHNPGKHITDNLATVEIDPEALDTFSEIHPLPELPGVMKNKEALIRKIEIPKWRKRGKIARYGLGSLKSLLKMDLIQLLDRNKKSPDRQADLKALKEEIREFAASAGYIAGFTKIDRRFIAECRDRKFPFDTALVLGMEMDRELLSQAPYPGEKLFDFEIYIESGKRVFDVARFIRSKGYRCWARVPLDGWVKYPPHAINAGLGELGANGVVITRQFGPRQRWTMISIDAEIEPDPPADFNMAAYCDDCMICIKSCPGNAIPERRLWWRGVLKRKINDAKCWPYFVKYEGCGICLKVCPINRFGYNKCMEAYRKDGTILGASNGE